MSWLFSRALVEEYSAGNCSAGEPSAQLNVMPTPHKFWRNDKTMEFSNLSRFGLTLNLLTEQDGEALLMSYLAAFPARTSAQPIVQDAELMVNDPDYGVSSPGSLAKYDHDTHSWRTHQRSLFGDWVEFSEIWPRWGSMRDGESFQLAPMVRHIHVNACSYWPTPRASDRDNCGGSNARKKAQENGVYVGRNQNPQLQEWLMGWPIDWTDLRPAETAKFQSWLQQHGEFSPVSEAA